MAGYLGVVIHVTAGENDPYGEFANPKNQVSSHFFIANGQGGTVDGDLSQYVDTALESWAQMNGNATYISVETEGQPIEPLTPAQIETFARLYAWLHETHGIPFVITDTPGQPGFITHQDGGAAWGGHACPGPYRASQRQQILDLAAGHATKEESMHAVVTPDGKIKVYAASTGNHLLEFTRDPAKAPPDGTQNSVIDITAQIGGAEPFTVQP